MKIYIAHPSDMDYVGELYEPLKNDEFLAKFELILPHDGSTSIQNTREDYKNYDLIIAECSKPSLGLGIELGWSYDEQKPIYCFYKTGTKPSGALKAVAKEIIEYSSSKDLVEKIKKIVGV